MRIKSVFVFTNFGSRAFSDLTQKKQLALFAYPAIFSFTKLVKMGKIKTITLDKIWSIGKLNTNSIQRYQKLKSALQQYICF